MKTFLDLCDALPDCPGSDALPMAEQSGGFTYVETGLTEFVGPDLEVVIPSDNGDAPTISIISAAGAVGKSTLAKEVAFLKKAPIWDLAHATAVGAHSLDGQLTTSFGFSGADKATEMIKNDGMFIVVDALDEARVKANEAGYDAFIDNVAALSQGANGIAFLLLARTQTAESTWDLLIEAGVSVSLVTIQPFTRQQAERYIELRINQLDAAAAERIASHRGPFIEARDLILNHLERAIAGDAEALTDASVREFLGYAPVLETVAVLLAKETNFSEFVSDLSGQLKSRPAQQLDRPLAVLNHVVTRLLDREHREKLVHNIRPALEGIADAHRWSQWESLYSPVEQHRRLLGCLVGRNFESAPPMPGPLRDQYEEQLKAWFPEHPFLRDGNQPANKVFESYLFAVALREHLTEMSRVVEAKVNADDYKPSRLLSDFYMLPGNDDTKIVPARHIGILYDSLLAGETDTLRVRLSIECGDPDESDESEPGLDGEFELLYAIPGESDHEASSQVRSFTVTEPNDGITFRRQLKEASVITQGMVSLGGDIDDFEIGPGVDVRCRSLEILSSGFVVRPGRDKRDDTDCVVLEAKECQYLVSRRPVVRGQLDVSWPGAASFPWNAYTRTHTRGVEGTDLHMHETYRRFRRIATALRSHSKGSLARLRDKIEHERIMKGILGRRLLEQLLNDGILVIKGKHYHWVQEQASQRLSVSWNDLRRAKSSPELTHYLSMFINDNSELF